MKKILEKSGKSQGILSEEKSGNPGDYVSMMAIRGLKMAENTDVGIFRAFFFAIF